jgi:hypothetical protein
MIRGVNRRIIEINDTGNKYFERALLFVRPDYADLPAARLHGEADRLICAIGLPPKQNRSRRSRPKVKISRVAALGCGAVIISALIFLLVWLLI